jgi:hypothetical protein
MERERLERSLVEWEEYRRFRSRFLEILDPELYTAEWLDTQVWTRNFRLFSTAESAILFGVKVYPTGLKEAEGQAAVGNLGEITRQLIPQFEAFGRAHGCRIATIQSRVGWAKVMKSQGYEVHQTLIRKAL